MRASYHPDYFVPLPENHRFPMGKFPVLHNILLKEGVLERSDITAPQEASWNELRLVHTSKYLLELVEGTLDPAAERRLGLPWSEALVRRSRLATQGTINAGWMALEDGISGNLAGGTHHAFPDHGEGFCVLNDVAVAALVLRRNRAIRRSLIVDLDVHQGNGTAAIFANDSQVYTFSMHGERNYPFRKASSDCDVALQDNTPDEVYLGILARHLPQVIEASRPDLIFYLAGIDPMAGDRFGRLALTRDGLNERDRQVLQTTWQLGIPLVIVLSGGYASTVEATADLHANVFRQAKLFHR